MTSDGIITFSLSFSNTNYIFISTARGMNRSARDVHAYAGSGDQGTITANTINVRGGGNATGRDWIVVGE